MKTLFRFVVLGLVTAPLAVQAQAPAEAGKRIATQGAGGVAACLSCHGANGEGNAAGGFPRLAGLPAYYFAKQLHAFADGSRDNAVMGPIAKALNAEQVDALAAYYSGLQPKAVKAKGAAPGRQATTRASTLATRGDESKMIQACANCHGAGGGGEPPVYPYLAGQHASYIENALREWKSGQRKTDPSGQMPAIAQKLNDDDIKALAVYFASLPPPLSAAHRAATPANAGPSSGRSNGGATPAQGVGSEQGAGTTGGSQGPGGSDTGATPRQDR